MIIIPNRENKIITQINKGDTLGDLWSSFNIDLVSNYGRIRNTRMIENNNSSFEANLGCAVAFRYFDSKWWAVAGSRVHSSSRTQTGFTADVTASTPTTCSSDTSDIELFNGNMYVTSQTGLNKFTGSVWSTNAQTLNTNTPHLMTNYAERLYITDLYSKIYSMNTSDSVAISSTNTLSFTNSLANVITFLRSASNTIWIGTINTQGGKGAIYEWNGVSTQTNRSYRLESGGALSCVIKDDIPWIVDTNGRLMYWNGGSFIEVARFPIFPDENILLYNAFSQINDRFIHPNGMSLVNGKINILINNLNDDFGATISERLPSGVWEYDENKGLYHKYSISYTGTATTIVTDYGQNRLSRVGALLQAKVQNNASGANGTLLAGATYFTNASSIQSGIFFEDNIDTTQKYGYFVTNWISSLGLKDTWQKIFIKYRKFLASTDKIIVKYRIAEVTPTEVSITWTSTTTFTTTTNILSKEGFEVEIIQGTGSGKTAHITLINVNAGTYTVTVDDTFTGVTTGTAKARIQAWIKIGEVTGQTTESWGHQISKVSERIQLKVCMQFTGKDEISELAIINEVNQPMV